MKTKLLLGCTALVAMAGCGAQPTVSSNIADPPSTLGAAATVDETELPFTVLRNAVLGDEAAAINSDTEHRRIPIARQCLELRGWQPSDALMTAYATHPTDAPVTFADYARSVLAARANPVDVLWTDDEFSADMGDCWQQASVAIANPVTVFDEAMQTAEQAVADAVHARADFRAAQHAQADCYSAAGYSSDDLAAWNNTASTKANQIITGVSEGSLSSTDAESQLAKLNAEERAVLAATGPCDAAETNAERIAAADEQQKYLALHPDFQHELESVVQSVLGT